MAVFGDINEAQVLGNITQDLEVRYTANGSPVVNFSVATNRSYRKQGEEEWTEETTFHNIVVWGQDAEYLSQRSRKGTRIYVKGRLQTRSWEDADGKKNYRTEIIAERVILIDRYERGSSDSMGQSDTKNPNQDKQSSPAKEKAMSKKEESKASKKSESNEIDPDDLPF
jgi:single-strand DNA-binding protein